MNKTALITGASSGIGKSFAYVHAQKNGHLILIARRKEKLESLKAELENKFNVNVLVITKDLAKPEAVYEIFETVQSNQLQVDYLINNAGFGGHGFFHERTMESDLAMIQVNVVALTSLTKLFLPGMIERNEGKILNVSSTASFLPGPLQAVYYATKAFVTSMGEAISEEIRDTNVTVTTLCPGAVQTEFAKRGNMEEIDFFQNAKSPDSVAKFGYEAMLKGKGVVINEPKLRLMPKVLPLLPRKLLLKISRQIMEKPN